MKHSKQEIERLVNLLNSPGFALAYLLETGKKLETVEQAVDAFIEGIVTLEDMFHARLDHIFIHAPYDIQCTWEDHMKKFDFENYFPFEKRLPEGGAWIKLRTDNGYQLHNAKVSSRKRRLNEEIDKIKLSLSKELKKDHDTINLEKMNHLKNEMLILSTYRTIALPLYEIRYNRTKTKVEYINPYQYEICSDEDLQLILNAVRGRVTGVKMRNLYSAVSKDQIFYLQTRGISREEAMILANLKQCYFEVDIVGMTEEYNRQIGESLRLHSVTPKKEV